MEKQSEQAVLNTLQSVPDYPHRFQVYLKEGLSNLKSSKVSEGQTISSTPSSKEQGTEPQTVSEAEPITTNDTPLLRSPTETGWFRSFNTKTSSLKRTKETASADTENPLDTVSDSAREVSVPLKGGDFLEEDEKASAVSDSDLTLDAHGDDLTDGIKNVLRVSKKKTKPPDEPFPEETSGSLISTIGHFFIPSQLGKHFKSTDSLPPLERSQEPDQDLKHDTFSSDQDADISSALDKSVEEDGSDYDECQIGQEEEIKEEVKGQAQEEGWMRHPILLFKPNTYRTLVNKTLSWKGKSQSLDNLSDPVIATFNVTSHKQKNPQDDVNLLEDSTDESEQITDLEFEHLQDVFSAAKAVPKIKPSKLKFWQLVPYVYLGTIKPNNTEHGLKKATSLDSVVSEPLSPSIPVHEEEGVNFVDTNDNFKKFIIGNQRLHIDVDRLKRFATTGMAEGISSSGQSGTDVKSGGILGFVRGAGGRLSALGLSRKSKGHGSAATANGSKSDAQNSLKQNESGLQPTSSIDLDAKQAGKPSEIDKTLPVDDKSEDEEYDVFDNSGKSSGNTEELQFTFKKDRQTKLGRSTSERKLSRRPGKGLRRSESDMQVFYKPRNTTNRKESLDGIGTESSKKVVSEDDVDISSTSPVKKEMQRDQLSLTTTQERLPSNFTTIIEGKSDEEKSDLISIPTSPSTSKEKTETTVGSFVRGTRERLSLIRSGKKKKDQSLKDKQGEWVVVSQGSPTVGDDPVSNEQIDQTSPPAGKEEEEESPKDEVSLKKAPNVLLSPFRKIGKRRDSSQEEGIGKTLDIAATNDSLARAQSYQHQVDSKRLKKEWSSTRDDVESFVGTAAKSLSDGYGLWKLGDQDDDREDSILTSHWEKSKNHKNCQGCQTSFSALARFRRSSKRGHCRKCGQVFCNGCLGYMRKLNTFAQYDPSGKECKVCKHCHNPETAPVTEGMTSSHLELFKKHRDNFKHYGWDIELASEQYRFEPTVSSMLRQCKKLEKGFQGSVSGKSGLKVPNLALMKKNIPDWQKPPTWVDPSNKDITGCQLCSRSKLLPGSLHNCRICGRRVCSQDSSSDFLLYIPDRGTVEYSPENSTRWKIIRIVGCPQTEPAICMYLRVCFTCKGKLSTLQEETFQHFRLSLSDEYELCMLMLQGIHKETQQMKSSILECMPKFIDAVDMLGKDSKNITETQRKSLANHQDNLMEQFPKFIMAVDKLRDITPKTEQQVRLVRNVLQEKWAFYRDNVANFRIRGRQLMEIMPEEEIKQLKYIVNREAINCACLIVTQLAFEVLHISMQRNLSESFAMTLKDIGEIIEQELKQMITSSSSGESWEDHRENLYDFVKDEMKSDRRFLKLTAERGEGIERFIYKECERRILSTILQLDAKSSSRSFKKSKQALQSLLAECHNKLT
ncbi:uncharacterized protein [Apostichopus japonicus]|uniref:uncharacterized protein isoform X3 n=1 Tax=Stichopus japonicus TaxID=307972 RepID=UPI003AB24209